MEGRKGEMDGIQIIYNWDLLPDAVRIVLKMPVYIQPFRQPRRV
jgi:hypothetical protein